MNEKITKKVLSDEELMEITGGATYSDDFSKHFFKFKKYRRHRLHKKPPTPEQPEQPEENEEPVMKYGIVVSKYGIVTTKYGANMDLDL